MANGLSSMTSCFLFSVLHACSFRWVTVESPMAEGEERERREGLTDGWE